MNEPLFFDVETTGAVNKTNGNPFTKHNRLVLGGLRFRGSNSIFSESSFIEAKERLSKSFIVGFNVKFDLHWANRYAGLS